VLTRERHREAVNRALGHVCAAEQGLRAGAPVVFVAEDMRLASRALAEISGEAAVEEVLDRVFSTFCIGK
jgi:tRNA modification GTPase